MRAQLKSVTDLPSFGCDTLVLPIFKGERLNADSRSIEKARKKQGKQSHVIWEIKEIKNDEIPECRVDKNWTNVLQNKVVLLNQHSKKNYFRTINLIFDMK